MQRDEFRCQECGSTTETLNIHHHFYERGKEPWEAKDEQLETFCEGCHLKIENLKTCATGMMFTKRNRKILRDSVITAHELAVSLGIAEKTELPI